MYYYCLNLRCHGVKCVCITNSCDCAPGIANHILNTAGLLKKKLVRNLQHLAVTVFYSNKERTSGLLSEATL